MRSFYHKALLVVITIAFSLPTLVFAGTLSIYPASGSFEQNKTFTVKVSISSPDQAINAASGVLTFPVDKLRAISISKAESIMTLWVQEPSFSNSNGTVSFEGVVPNPGYTGTNATVINITFKVIGQGTAPIKFNSGSILANDGEGTNISRALNGASYNLIVSDVEPVPVKKEEKVPEKVIENVVVPVVIESVKAPTIIDFPKKIQEGSPIKVSGTTYPDAVITLSLKDSRGQIFSQITHSNDIGDFSTVWSNKINRGDYELTGIVVTRDGVKSLPSEALQISIIATPTTNLKFSIIDYASLITTIIICLSFIAFFLLYLFKGFAKFKKKIWRDTLEIENSLHTEFDDLKDAVKKELLVFDKVKSIRELTKEESRFVDKINKHIARIEKNVNRKLDTVKKDVK